MWHTAGVLALAGVTACAATVRTGDGPEADAAQAADAPSDVDAGRRPDARVTVAQMYAHTADELFIVDDASFDLVRVGPFGLDPAERITDLAVAPDGSIYAISKTKLYVVDRDTATATYRADVPGTANVGLTWLADGTLLATDKTGGVRQIDPRSGAVTEIGSFGGGYATAGDLVAVADGTMYAISDQGPVGDEADNNVLLTVSTTTGAATPVGPIGYGGVFGCAVANNKVYAFTRDGVIIEIDPHTGAGTERRTHAGVAFWGAGVTPLAIIE